MAAHKGLIHVDTGDGKGKTTAAIGLGVRAVGAGLRVHMIQFMKGRRYSELDVLERLPGFTVVQFGRDEFVSKKKPEQIDIDLAQKGLAHAQEVLRKNEYDVVILDEINVAVDYRLISLADVLELMKMKSDSMELILTGRYANPELVRQADLVSEMLEIKHPYRKGVPCRKGIDW
jgi:cob(I)alamin adenosyltransferase